MEIQEKNFARLMVTPAVGLLFLVTIAPLLFSLGVSFTNLQFGSPQPMRWSGLDNYVRLLSKDARFLSALWRTILLVVGGVVTQTILGYVIAALLFRIRRGRTILLSAILIPSVISQVVAGLARFAADGLNHHLSDRHLAMDALSGSDYSRGLTKPAPRHR